MSVIIRAARERALLAGGVLAVTFGALVILAPLTLNFDAFSWLTWGDELTGGGLETSGGPSWKPGTVLVAIPLALFPDAAPEIWRGLVAAAWLGAVMLGGVLTWRLTPEHVRAAIPGGAVSIGLAGALSVVLIEQFRTAGWLLAAVGLSEPPMLALLLAGFLAHLDGRRGLATGLVFAACLIRPEAWALLVLLAIAYRHDLPGNRILWGGLALAIPALWLVPDLLASGDALTGAERARSAPQPNALYLVAERIGPMPMMALWPAAAWAAIEAWRRRDRPLLELAAVVIVWVGATAAMALVGYGALPRFMLPAATGVGILGVIGLGEMYAFARRPGAASSRSRVRLAVGVATAVIALAAVADAGTRLVQWSGDTERFVDYAADQQATLEVAREGAAAADCDLLAVQGQHLSAVMRELDVAFPETLSLADGQRTPGTLLVQGPLDAITFAGVPIDPPPPEATPLAERDGWTAYANECGWG